MSVIFKEQHYDQILFLIKNLTIVIIILLIIISCYNFFAVKKLEKLRVNLESLIKEELKYQSLINKQKSKDEQKIEAKISQLLISLARSAQKVKFSSIQLADNMLQLRAICLEQEMIFELIEALKKEQHFKDVRLLNVNQKENIIFEVEMPLKY